MGPDGAHGLSAQERDAIRFGVAQGITGRAGNAPRGWRRWAEEALHPPRPWRELLLLVLLHTTLTVVWLGGYALLLSKARRVLEGPRTRRAFERTTGVVLIGFGLALVTAGGSP
ncbi:LysE family transporter [Streptomyces sp. NPDC001222]|uniref:LysE family transporter n=1 Tax=Streptomyces sp. NPDC001222 TaxID=3364548 RepID=UPI0036AB0486